jgi:hypothetical protein
VDENEDGGDGLGGKKRAPIRYGNGVEKGFKRKGGTESGRHPSWEDYLNLKRGVDETDEVSRS